MKRFTCPLKFGKHFWPDNEFWSAQRRMILGVKQCVEVAMPACKEIGKDYGAGFVALSFFIDPRMYFDEGYVAEIERQRKPGWNPHTRRIITTSIKDEHLDVLWGEIARFYTTCKVPLNWREGGPLVMNHHEIRFASEGGADVKNPLNYLRGQVSKPDSVEGMSGHHAAYTLFIGDEASGLSDSVHKGAQGWAKKFLYPGNTNPCRNFWYRMCKEGDKRDESGKLTRMVISVAAVDSPNVAYALKEKQLGRQVTNTILVPGVLSYERYEWKRANLREVEQQIDLDAKFPSDASVLLFPEGWLAHSVQKAAELDASQRTRRQAKAMGIDPAEGGDRTAFCIIDEHGIIELVSLKTPNTNTTFEMALSLMRKFNVPSDKIVFDRACGKAHADRMRGMGFKVQTVHFGESIKLDLKRGITKIEDKREAREEGSLYKNRRAEMYHDLAAIINPSSPRGGFGMPARLRDIPRPNFSLFDQLEPIPYMFDRESGDGKLMLPPKDEMIELLYNGLGSPDEADALVLAVWGLTHKSLKATAGAA